jgi:putative hemolysin
MLSPRIAPPERAVGRAQGARLEVKIAEYPWEVRQSQRLRYRVFADEMGARVLGNDRGIEHDHYDGFCSHLLVKDVCTGEVVAGTRVLTDMLACLAGGFYSQGEFDLGGVLRCGGGCWRLGAPACTRITETAPPSGYCGAAWGSSSSSTARII